MKTENIFAFGLGAIAGYAIFSKQNDAAVGYTIKEAQNNDRNIRIEFAGYGHWDVSADYRGKRVKIRTTDSMAIDDFKSDPYEKDGRENRRKRGYTTLMNAIARAANY